MKNEVKKKMMMDQRKLSHQSHHERSSEAKVDNNFVSGMEFAVSFCSAMTRRPAWNSPETRRIDSRDRKCANLVKVAAATFPALPHL
jgi:hypothetical protein